jgi:hypothetical protein
MDQFRRALDRVGVDAMQVGTTVRHYYRPGDSLATVTEKIDEFVAFVGPDCDGHFTHQQIEEMIDDGRLRVVIDDVRHD